jgi:hypothetical protein
MCRNRRIRKILLMRCALEHAVRRRQRTGADVYDREDSAEQQYERTGSSAMSYVVLAVLVAVVGAIAGFAAWTCA